MRPHPGAEPDGTRFRTRGRKGPLMRTALSNDSNGTLPRHYLKPCLLLLLAEGPSHGYELLEHVRRMGIKGAEPGGLYRYLRAMEKEEMVSSWWEPSQAGPARRTYVLTEQAARSSTSRCRACATSGRSS